jgi:hypothetical protein
MENEQDSEKKQMQMALFKQRGLDAYLNRDLSKFQERFETLQLLLDKPANNDNYEQAFGIFYDIIDAVPLLYNELNGSDIFRAQTNKPNELFNSQSRISYNKTNPKLIGPGKFNVWYEPMFYGCLPYRPVNDNEYLPPYLTATFETCKELKSRTIPLQDFTIGQWKNKSPFHVINLCFDDFHLAHNYELKRANDEYVKNLTANLSSPAGDFVHQLFKYYSELCRTGSNEGSYYILTALFNAIRQYYGNENAEVNGLISCSAATDGVGLNIVLTPAAVNKYLYLNAAFMYRFFLVQPEAQKYAAYPCSEIILNHQKIDDFNFSFKEYLVPAERFLKRMNL